jgi:protein-S-isoprenylcysteine O-methyltransferase Ste14
MRTWTLWQVDLVPWYVLLVYWAISALRVKRNRVKENWAERFVVLVVVVLAFCLLFCDWMRIGRLQLRFLPQQAWIGWTGIALTFAGVAFALWARISLGAYWSGRVTLKEGHRLIRSGPYKFVRNPIYTGMLLAMVGSAIVAGQWRGVLAVALLYGALSAKALREEGLLLAEFKSEYEEYRHSTGFLLPRLVEVWLGYPPMDTQSGRS